MDVHKTEKITDPTFSAGLVENLSLRAPFSSNINTSRSVVQTANFFALGAQQIAVTFVIAGVACVSDSMCLSCILMNRTGQDYRIDRQKDQRCCERTFEKSRWHNGPVRTQSQYVLYDHGHCDMLRNARYNAFYSDVRAFSGLRTTFSALFAA
jgi:hypothetical protein